MKLTFTTAVLFLLSACSSQPQDDHDYLLRPGAMVALTDDVRAVVLSRVEVAPYLDQKGIALELTGGEITVARSHRWAEPLSHSLGRYLQVVVSSAAGRRVELPPIESGESDARIEIVVHQFHGSVGGDVTLVAEWTLTRGIGAVEVHQFRDSLRIERDGYAALVEAHKRLLNRFGQAIADALQANA